MKFSAAFAGVLLWSGIAVALGGCNALTRISEIGEAPPLTTIQDPQKQPGYRPVSLPMPSPITAERRPNSLWQAGTRAFFKDQRAAQIGDILTVVINISEQANLANETVRSRVNSENSAIPHAFGFETQLQKILPHAADPTQLLAATSNSSSDGKASITRTDQVKVNVAMLVTQVLPNGNLVVIGHQEMRVNYEVRDLQITGVIRPQDISATNTISLDKIAEARVAYGGRGQLMDVQQPRYGQQLFDIVSPF
ncbi:MAG: flagellar basal body L-ring protein FlgH [Alphaproteobacteria bacterium]|nr:flagellar basal body L-ring protein FlgH [Alphaproteobacteria bacterium]